MEQRIKRRPGRKPGQVKANPQCFCGRGAKRKGQQTCLLCHKASAKFYRWAVKDKIERLQQRLRELGEKI